ncbi:MAG: rubredoxin [Clostridia bacterium]|jgi:predicted  nucleic acid-binding Zn-ribbon protein|nr:rubredoxin [Clostridia bacterium]
MYKCSVCGLVHWGEEPFEKCPKCGTNRENFKKLDEAEEALIQNSRITNELHMGLFEKLREVEEICEAGSEINLDPGCYKIFNELLDIVYEKQQEILAEISGHVNKGKWN